MGSLSLLVILVFVVLFVIALPTVISDFKSERQKGIKNQTVGDRRDY
jgi:competence protein ComGC